jgi:tetratricopeptide (TPR) repeat protein
MTFLNRWFGSSKASGGKGRKKRLKEELAEFESAFQRAGRGFQGSPLNRAGDVCVQRGEHRKALEYYGRAIDTFLEDGQRDAARGVANKIIRLHPVAVRTLCTLTWLDLAALHMGTAREHLREYWEAASREGRGGLARNEILEMARLVSQDEFLSAAADALDQLNFPDDAAKVRAWAAEGGSPDALEDPEELADRCVERAVGSNAVERAEREKKEAEKAKKQA